MILLYQGGNERFVFKIDRKNKLLEISSSQTGNRLVPAGWKNLFDKGKEELQERITDKLKDETFIEAITLNMAKAGYSLVSKC